jgi:hypothetical protein
LFHFTLLEASLDFLARIAFRLMKIFARITIISNFKHKMNVKVYNFKSKISCANGKNYNFYGIIDKTW